MNKKDLLIKIVEFIHKANIKYKKSETGDIWILLIITFMSSFGIITMLMTILIIMCLRVIYIFDILERLGVINEEEKNKTNDEKITKNIR